jgi:hypothetical protein
MFFAEAQIRVHLYGEPADMRKYALRSVMRSCDLHRVARTDTDQRVVTVTGR